MLTTPDQVDAVTPCPPFSPVGARPGGFFADCNPAENFAGTRPIAEYFNELIVNLRALLTQAGIAAVKGDPTMLWHAILQLPLIGGTVTVNVAPTGTATPANPFGGDPFNSLASALMYLARYRLLPTASITIQIAAGTYTATTPSVFALVGGGSITGGSRVTIVGAGSGSTILRYNGCAGLVVSGTFGPTLQHLTIQGDGTGAGSYGVYSSAPNYTTLDTDVVIQSFAQSGIYVSFGGAVAVSAPLTISNCAKSGIAVISPGGLFNSAGPGALVTLQNCGTAAGGAAVSIVNGTAQFGDLVVQGGLQGILVTGPAALYSSWGKIQVLDCLTPASAVQVANGAMLGPGDAGGHVWEARTTAGVYHTFFASNYGAIFCSNQLSAGNRANSSPLPNTLGNVQAWITP